MSTAQRNNHRRLRLYFPGVVSPSHAIERLLTDTLFEHTLNSITVGFQLTEKAALERIGR